MHLFPQKPSIVPIAVRLQMPISNVPIAQHPCQYLISSVLNVGIMHRPCYKMRIMRHLAGDPQRNARSAMHLFQHLISSVPKCGHNTKAKQANVQKDEAHSADNVGSWQVWTYNGRQNPWNEKNVKPWGSNVEGRMATFLTFQEHYVGEHPKLKKAQEEKSYVKVADALNKLNPGIHTTNLTDLLNSQ